MMMFGFWAKAEWVCDRASVSECGTSVLLWQGTLERIRTPDRWRTGLKAALSRRTPKPGGMLAAKRVHLAEAMADSDAAIPLDRMEVADNEGCNGLLPVCCRFVAS
jgi:hypothetical protein